MRPPVGNLTNTTSEPLQVAAESSKRKPAQLRPKPRMPLEIALSVHFAAYHAKLLRNLPHQASKAPPQLPPKRSFVANLKARRSAAVPSWRRT